MHLSYGQRVMLSLFTGPGGTEVGLRRAGWRATDAIEFDPHACATLRYNFPDLIVHERDIREILVGSMKHQYYPVAIYTWPCDHYSRAAELHGTRTGDDLYLQALRFQSLLWPELILIENVEGMKEKYPVVMETWRNLAGYYCSEFSVSGHNFSIMRKQRLFMILHRQPFQFPSVREFLRTHPLDFPAILRRPGRTLGDYLQHVEEMDADCLDEAQVLPYIQKRIDGGYARLPKIWKASMTDAMWLPTDSSRDRGQNLAELADGTVRPFTHRELANLHTFPPTHKFCGGKVARYTQVVDSVMPVVAYLFGLYMNMYFASIQELMPQPQALGHRIVNEPILEIVTTTARPEPIQAPDLVQATLF